MKPEAKQELARKIVLERIKAMAPNVKIALGSQAGFLNKEQLLEEVGKNTPIGKKIVEIHWRYLKALKESPVM